MEEILNRAADHIYDLISGINKNRRLSVGNAHMVTMLTGLNPGTEKEELLRNYYTDKIKKVIIVLLAALFLIAASYFSSKNGSRIEHEAKLIRHDYGENSYSKQLTAVTGESEYDIDVTVKERIYSKEQTKELFERLSPELEKIILGENESLDHVTSDLNIVSRVEGYPFTLRWESRDYAVIHEDGTIVKDEVSDMGTDAQLICILTYEDNSFEKSFMIRIYPEKISPLQEEKNSIIASIQKNQEETKTDEYLTLPKEVGEKQITWKEAEKPTTAIMAILSLITVIGIWWGMDNDLAGKYEKRDQSLRLEYSEFVSKLQLLISSGMTLRPAFERMGADYRSALKEGHDKKYVYEELLVCLKRLKEGASEAEVYTMFGDRCGQITYKKLMTLLTQNLRKGTGKIVSALSYETKAAFEEQKHIAKRMGDEAQTKLLFPMIIMLSIVMIIIMIPAYFSFGA